jgi:hypothetical protein
VISTGKSDWEPEITWARDSLAYHLSSVSDTSAAYRLKTKILHPAPASSGTKGVFEPGDSPTLFILNGSHKTICEEENEETILVFPDYRIVAGVERSADGAKRFNEQYGKVEIGPEKSQLVDSLHTWVIPYSYVILLCEWHLDLVTNTDVD